MAEALSLNLITENNRITDITSLVPKFYGSVSFAMELAKGDSLWEYISSNNTSYFLECDGLDS